MTEAAESKIFRLSRRLSVEITTGAAGFVCEWTPDIPKQMTPRERRAYRKAMQEMLARLAEKTGGAVVCVEVKP